MTITKQTIARSIEMFMHRSLLIASLTTILTSLSLYLWRIAFTFSDWAALALVPLLVIIGISFWKFILDPWKARLDIAIRHESAWKRWLTGKLRATILSAVFSLCSVILLAYQALRATAGEATLVLILLFGSALAFSYGQKILLQHFHQPFARTSATHIVTWVMATIGTIVIAASIWNFTLMPGGMLNASFLDALKIGLDQLPPRQGIIIYLLSIPYGYEAAKLWTIVQLRDYPILTALFSIDAALFSFVLCRTGIIIAQFVETSVLKQHQPLTHHRDP